MSKRQHQQWWSDLLSPERHKRLLRSQREAMEQRAQRLLQTKRTVILVIV